jgi:DNA-binding response OmpR family regulator
MKQIMHENSFTRDGPAPAIMDRKGEGPRVAILVIEDEARIRAFLKRGLTEEGFTIDTAADGDAGLSLARGGAYELIVLDLQLPKRDGIDVCRTLRAEGIGTPIIMLTGRGAVEERVIGLDAGADDYLTKPFAFEELVARVRALLRRDGATRPATLQIGDLVLDPATRTATRAGRAIALTTREYQLLFLLMRHPGQVLTRVMIEERVWGPGVAVGSNVVDAFIRLLRRKIDPGHERPLIHTVRGAGYVMRA